MIIGSILLGIHTTHRWSILILVKEVVLKLSVNKVRNSNFIKVVAQRQYCLDEFAIPVIIGFYYEPK